MNLKRLALLATVVIGSLLVIAQFATPFFKPPPPMPPASVDSEAEWLEWAFELRELSDPPARTPVELTVEIPLKPGAISSRIEMIRTLMAEHPKTAVRNLYAESRAGTVGMYFMNVESATGATFSLLHRGEIQARGRSHTHYNREVSGYVPTMGVNLAAIPTEFTEMNIVDLMLRIYHETWHWLQYKRATDDELHTFKESTKRSQYNQEQCAFWLSAELEAYNATCRVADEWGALGQTENSSCRYEDRADRDYYLFRNIIRATPFASTRNCQRTWAELVGHPHPELFPYQGNTR